MDNVCYSSFLCYVCGKLPPVEKRKQEVGLLTKHNFGPGEELKSSHCLCIIYLQ